MGCLCSKESKLIENYVAADYEKEKEASAPSRREKILVGLVNGSFKDSVHTITKPVMQQSMSSVRSTKDEEDKKNRIIERPVSGHHKRRATLDLGGNNGGQTLLGRVVSISEREHMAAGWPTWLSSVAGEAIQGWVPRSADSFEKLGKIGQGTYSSVYKARDLKTGKIVAMKKVRFMNMDPESVRFMAREIHILRKLDHPNVMKLEGLVTSRMSGSLYLVFEYMEHDLAGLAASSKVKFTESQIKCYMLQLLRGLEYCHSRGVLHRDIKGSNLLVDNNGVLKIGDFGLATFFKPDQQQPLTSRVVTLWYRAPELLLGATQYGVAIDLWSVGCILAELFAGKPIMPGRTEVEQMHKIFKLCGSPSEEYWKKSKLPHSTSFKPQHPYPRRVSETFKEYPSSALALIDVLLSINPERRGTAASALNSEFFTTKPLACDPSSLPIYPPSKEFDVKLRQEEARRRKAESVKGRGSESVARDSRQSKEVPTPEFNAQVQGHSNSKCTSEKYHPQDEVGSGFPIEPPRVSAKNITHSSSMVHPSAAASIWAKKVKEDQNCVGSARISVSSKKGLNLSRQASQIYGTANPYSKRDERISTKDSMGTLQNKRRIHYSGPLMPPGGTWKICLKNMSDKFKRRSEKHVSIRSEQKKNCHDHGAFHYY